MKILRETHWSSKGWRNQFVTAPEDLAYAISKGVMFPPAILAHDATLQEVREHCAAIAPAAVGRAFLVGLGTGEPALRSALGSFAVARHQPGHAFVSHIRTDCCRHCGLQVAPKVPTDLNILNFERMKWGGVRHTCPAYQWLDLGEFRKMKLRVPKASEVSILRSILAEVRQLPTKAKIADLEKAIAGKAAAGKSERQSILAMLSYCGVLAYPGYRNYVDHGTIPDRKSRESDAWGFPAIYWRAVDGWNGERLREYFPEYAEELEAGIL